MYNTFIESGKHDHIKLYKCSQDHLELFFGTVRGHGGYNNNPTAQQFRAAYRKLVIRVNNVQSFNTGNCIPLEDIDIFHYSSTDLIKVLNNNSIGISSDAIIDDDNVKYINSFIMDNDYIGNNSQHSLSQFTKEIIIYIAGFVVHKPCNSLKCDECKLALVAVEKYCFFKFFHYSKE